MATISPVSLMRNSKEEESAPSVDEIRGAVKEATSALLEDVEKLAASEDDVTFRDAEARVGPLLLALGRAVVVLFLALREQRVMERYAPGARIAVGGRAFLRAPAIPRNLTTMFGVVRYWRTYMREIIDGRRHGFHPLDVSLGLSADRFSWAVLSRAVWLATKLSFAEARQTLAEFVPSAPSTEVIEKATLGFGQFAEEWFHQRPAPDDDGEVLVVLFDSKGIPTATELELARRRGKRRKQKGERSPRHRGRQRRQRYPKKPRRKKGDKSKNAKCATMVVMYTLRREGTRRLVGPVNKWIYASFAPKQYAFQMARMEANKRGFVEGSSKLVQVVTDGDPDLETYCAKYFPTAEHTIDFWHVIEYLWEAGRGLFKEGS